MMNKFLCNCYQTSLVYWGNPCILPTSYTHAPRTHAPRTHAPHTHAPRIHLLQRNTLLAMMPEPSTPDIKTSDTNSSSSQPSPLELHTDTNELSELTWVVVRRVLASFAQPLNVVPISLHLVKMLEQFPAAPDTTSVHKTETPS